MPIIIYFYWRFVEPLTPKDSSILHRAKVHLKPYFDVVEARYHSLFRASMPLSQGHDLAGLALMRYHDLRNGLRLTSAASPP